MRWSCAKPYVAARYKVLLKLREKHPLDHILVPAQLHVGLPHEYLWNAETNAIRESEQAPAVRRWEWLARPSRWDTHLHFSRHL